MAVCGFSVIGPVVRSFGRGPWFRPGQGPVALPSGVYPGPASLPSLLCLALVIVSESPGSPVGLAVFGEGVVRVDSCVRLVPST
jgi:hypothetical protein